MKLEWERGYLFSPSEGHGQPHRYIAHLFWAGSTETFWVRMYGVRRTERSIHDTGCADKDDAQRVTQAIYLLTR